MHTGASAGAPLDIVHKVRRLQGTDTQAQFASRLGVDQSELSRFLRRKRRLGRKVAVGLIAAFPEMRDEIVDALAEQEPAAVAS